jgi:cobyrinic acid a,c-diamide synthase
LIVAGSGSGVGKTSLTLGLVRAFARRGLRVQTFKVGPDFLDPTYLAAASGRDCYNLDGWMTSRDYVRDLFATVTADADLAVIEGVMGLFDGASPCGLEGSTAEIALWLDAPVLLVLHAHGVARSLAAAVKGFAEFEPGVRFAGVIANHCGSARHKDWLGRSLAQWPNLPPLLGAVPRGAMPTLESRHLGLVTADSRLDAAILDQLADVCGEHLDLERLLETSRNGASAPPRIGETTSGGLSQFSFDENGTVPFGSARIASCLDRAIPSPPGHHAQHGRLPQRERGIIGEPPSDSQETTVRIGIARDEAFHFYYADNLQQLRRHGAELVPFSPLSDAALPEGLDALYFGGGYPELYAARLGANTLLLESVRQLAAAGRCIYAECGGLMYLGRSLVTLDGDRFLMAGVLPIDTRMLKRRKMLGYAQVELAADSLWGPPGWRCRGHEFHYSEIAADDSRGQGWQPAYVVRNARGDRERDEGTISPARKNVTRTIGRIANPSYEIPAPRDDSSSRGDRATEAEGFARGSILASYIHLHWAADTAAVRHFLARCLADCKGHS